MSGAGYLIRSWERLRAWVPVWLFGIFLVVAERGGAQTFVHPGGLHTRADLDRMKAEVAAGAHPWIDDWNTLITDSLAQTSYGTHVQANMGTSRQNADLDAHAAYLDAIRWYVSGNTAYADKAVSILNGWSAAVNQIPTGTDMPGLIGIPIMDFALAGETLRTYSGWAASDFARFKGMMTTYLYPVCHDFLTNHNGAAADHYWANWDACNTGALIAMGVLCDDASIFNEGVAYFENGAGNGCIMNAVYYLHTPALGQWQESGRDQEHAQLGIGLLGSACQVAWNQGVDLFGYGNNRLLAGAEYVAKTNLSQPVPFKYYTNSDAVNQPWVSVNGIGRLDDRPVWELIYNHYAVLEGLSAPYSQAMAQMMRPEHGSSDHLGYGTLTFTLAASTSPYPPLATPAAPTGLTATGSVSRVELSWDPSLANAAQGYSVLRSNSYGGPYASIVSWTANTYPHYADTTVTNGTTYYYVVAANNQSGTSVNSAQASAMPVAAGALPTGWVNQDVGTAGASGGASYAAVENGTFLTSGTGAGIGGTSDAGYNYTYTTVTGNYTLTARLSNASWSSGGGEVGLMMRETLAADSSELQMTLGGSGQREAEAGVRTSTGSNLNHYGGNDYTWIPVWFRLQRSGNTFTAYESSDGVTWYVVKSATIAMASSYYVGLVMDNGSSTPNAATFDHVISTAQSAPTGLVGAPSTGRVALSWIASAGATSYSVERSTVSGGPYTTLATGVTDTRYTDTTAASGTTYYYIVTATDSTGDESVYSAETAVVASTVGATGFTAYAGSIVLGQGGILSVDNSTGTYATSVIRSSSLTVNGGPVFSAGSISNEPANLLDTGSGAGSTDDLFGPLILNTGPLFLKLVPNAAGNLRLTFDSVTRSHGTQLAIDHAGNFGGVGVSTLSSATGGTANVVITTPPAKLMVGGGAAGSTSAAILPFAFVNNDLATYDSTYGLRGLNTGTEIATLASGMTAGQNAKITSGTVTLNANTTVNSLYGSGGTIAGSGTLTVTSGAVVCNVSYTIGNAELAFGPAEGQINVANARTLTLNSVITGTGGLTVGLENYNGANASLILGGANTYTGITTLLGNDPTLKVRLTNGLAFQNSTLDYGNYGASLQFGNGSTDVTAATLGGLMGAQSLALTNAGTGGGGVTLTVGGDGDHTTYTGVLSGAGGLVKTGAGTLTLAATNTYTGVTAVNAGALMVTGSLASGSGVTVKAGGTLGGTGTINGVTTIASGGTLSPGISGVGTLTVTGALTLNGGAVIALDLAGPAASDKLALTGTYAGPAGGTVTLNLSALTGFGAGSYPLITGAGGISAGSFTLGAVPAGYTCMLSASGGTLSLAVSAPPAPTGLTATAGDTQVTLGWNATAGATTYNVKRSTTSGGGYATVSAGGSGTGYTDTGLTDGSTYYYVVSAVNTVGESANSSEVGATPLTAYARWKATYGLSGLADTAAPDGDGIPILLKYATGLTPGGRALSPVSVVTVGGTLTIQFTRLSPAPVNYGVEASDDLSSWTMIASLSSGADTWSGSGAVTQSGSGVSRTVTVTDVATTSRRFLRLRVSL